MLAAGDSNTTERGMKKMSELFGLNDRVAVMTGTSSGLGVTFAGALAKDGADSADGGGGSIKKL